MHWRDELQLNMNRSGMTYAEIGRRAKLQRTTVQRVRTNHTPGMQVLFAICSVIHAGPEFEHWYAHYSCKIIKEKLSKQSKT
jgi:transcriptional regulator with XRE-family HTH domain